MQYKSVLPEGWYADLLDKADLEASFAALEKSRHFYVDAMRGRIRSLQLRVEEAWKHLDRAERLGRRVKQSVANLARQFLVHIYLFENALIEGPIDRTASAPELRIPALPQHLVDKYPEVRYTLELRLFAEGYLRLHFGDYHRASTIFQGLIDAHEKPPDANLALKYCGLAAAQHDLGLRDASRRSIENAGLALLTGGRLLTKLSASAVISAFYTYLDEPRSAGEWMDYLRSLPSPAATQEAFVARERLLLERCVEQQCLLIF